MKKNIIPQQLVRKNIKFALVQAKSKSPFEKGWNKDNNYDAESEILQQHLKQGGNYAVLTGNGLVVVDVDNKKDAIKISKILPKTFIVRSRKGLHLYFLCKHNKKIILHNDKNEHIGEVQSKGQCIIGPGSIHPSGVKYKVVEDVSIASITEEELLELLKPYMKLKKVSKKSTTKNKAKKGSFIKSETKFPNINRILKKYWKKGQRNTLTLALSGFLRKDNWDQENCVKLITYVANENNDEELKQRLQTINQTYKVKDVNKNDLLGYSGLISIMKERDVTKLVFLTKLAKGEDIWELVRNLFFQSMRPHAIEMTANILECIYSIKTCRTSSDDMFVYSEGYYKPEGHVILDQHLEKELKSYASTAVVTEVKNKIKRRTAIAREALDNVSTQLVNLGNGIYDISNDRLIPHSPEYLFLSKIPTPFKQDAVCPRFMQYLNEVLEPEYHEVIQEFIGYLLIKSNKFKKALILEGPSNTGKTVLINTLIHLLGTKNVSSVSLQKLCSDRFSTASLYGKIANIFDELKTDKIKDISTFKVLTGDGVIGGEKKFKDNFHFDNKAKLLFACNMIPTTNTDDHAYYNRWIIIPFSKVVPEDKVDRNLKQKLAKEAPGILQWSLNGLRRLLKNDAFSYDMTADDIRDYMQQSSDDIANFVKECLERAKGESILSQDMYEAYCRYFDEKRSSKSWDKKRSITAFSNLLPSYASFVRKGNCQPNNQKCWRNVKLKSDDFDLDDVTKDENGFDTFGMS